MYFPDISYLIIGITVLWLYNPIMTAIFITQRYSINQSSFFNKPILFSLIFLMVLLGQFAIPAIIQFLNNFLLAYKFDVSIFFVLYAVTITIIVVWDRVSRNKKHF